jgi:iron(III) transport system substrate-binding protein
MLSRHQAPSLSRGARRWLSTTIVGTAIVLLGACQPPQAVAPTSPDAGAPTAAAPAQPDGWTQLVESARREGTVVVYGPPGTTYRPALVDAFQQAYPGIKVDGTFEGTNERLSRVMTERTAGRHIPDVLVDGTGNLVTVLKDAGVVVPLQPWLIAPEVTDQSRWLQNKLWWSDAAEPYTVLQFVGFVNIIGFYNKTMVDPAGFTSYYDFLDPRWKGRIVATDVRRPGPGAAAARWMYKAPQLGPQFLERLYGDMDPILSSDQRQMIDWIAQGQYPLGFFLSGLESRRAEAQGLPIGLMTAEQFKEGGTVSAGWGGLAVLDQAPHPNATKLYVNWLLGRAGQDAWQRETKEPSLRTDLPKDGVTEAPKPGFEYANSSAEEYARVTADQIQPLITAARQRAGRE